MLYQSATTLTQALIKRDISCDELIRLHHQQIDRINPALNALVYENRDDVLRQASLVDANLLRQSSMRPLMGVPVTVKESFHMREFPTSVNYPPLQKFYPQQDSVLVKRLRKAGAIILGKTNVPTLLADSQTFGPLFPTCNNPFDISRSPGGSTGGGAAAVASGLSTLEIGSDIAGSIRNPSHYCGLFGLKPTQNGHVQDGHVPPLPNRNTGYLDMNSTGPLARTMADIRLAWEVCYSPRWEYLKYLPVQRDEKEYSSLQDFRIGVYDSMIGIHASNSVSQALDKVTSAMTSQGASVQTIKLDPQLCHRILKLWVKLFGFVVGQDFSWPMRQLLKLKFGKDLKGSRLDAHRELKQGLSLNFREFSKALREQQECIAEFLRLFRDFDLLVGPVSVGPAFAHNPKHLTIPIDGERINYADYCYGFVMPYNATRLPVLSFPTGLDNNGLPVGLSAIAPHFCEDRLMRFGSMMEAQGFGFVPPERFS